MRLINLSCFLSAIAFFPFCTFGQQRKSEIIQQEVASGNGKVRLVDGTEVTGTVLFNDNDGFVTLQNGNESRSFNARALSKFEFYSKEMFRTRLFYSMEFDAPETGRKQPEIFEVLKEFDSFMVLSRIGRLNALGPKNILGKRTSPLLTSKKNSLTLEQTETIYFVDMEGTFEPYLQIIERERGGDLMDYNTSRNKFIHSELFKKYTKQHFDALTTYANENKLSFKRKSDIVKILDEFERLNSN
jgi:hypothetical protein